MMDLKGRLKFVTKFDGGVAAQRLNDFHQLGRQLFFATHGTAMDGPGFAVDNFRRADPSKSRSRGRGVSHQRMKRDLGADADLLHCLLGGLHQVLVPGDAHIVPARPAQKTAPIHREVIH